ncbi:DUF1598 domain-containing protein [Alienimonas chondri]|uniref:DUF1598 domain-containing protein n=1 Tax=Alienimonas chondri TaxID=2681879 RepID=A0ABX1VAY2_9PLAN|nr:DUF1598 domain-containing protein [Alienimonas chondri]NNJ24591.1 hypothetical protein [Alienimonas chondri]
MRWTPLFAALLLAVASPAFAQNNNGGAGNGVLIDAAGALTTRYDEKLGTKLESARLAAFAAENLPADLNVSSDARKVSLVRLEAALDAATATGEEPDDAMAYLAGLTRIDAVLVKPPAGGEPGDLVLVGPAGGFAPDALGRMVSTAEGDHAGRPVLHLMDLLAALRGGDARRGGAIGCSIDPVPERQARMAQATAGLGAVRSVSQAAGIYRKLANILGDQTVRIYGVEPGSHFGVAMIEADYRMKLISLGLEPSGVRQIPSHLALIGPGANTVQRFYLTDAYEPFAVNADRTAFAFSGPRLRVVTEDQALNADGTIRDAGSRGVPNAEWAKRFSDNVAELCAVRPSFAALQNLYDLAMVSELIRAERLAEKASWKPSLLNDANRMPVPVGPAPKTVPTAFNSKRAGGTVIGLIGGGVSIRPGDALRAAGQAPDASGYLEAAREKAVAAPDARWWWD